MLPNEITYVVNDARCQAAIEEIESGMDTLKWLGEHLELYNDVIQLYLNW